MLCVRPRPLCSGPPASCLNLGLTGRHDTNNGKLINKEDRGKQLLGI